MVLNNINIFYNYSFRQNFSQAAHIRPNAKQRPDVEDSGKSRLGLLGKFQKLYKNKEKKI